MKQLEYTDFKEKLLLGQLIFYKNHIIRLNNSIRDMRVAKDKKIIEVNYSFVSRINENQLIYMLEWHRKRRKYTNEYECDKATFNYCTKKLNIDKKDIYILYETCNFNNSKERKKRIFNLLTISTKEHKILLLKQFFLKLWKKINLFAKQ